ncbi:MAG: Wzz/FepE/Etk N-terminal domain-containing protein [Mangrovibacterium sp.]
MNTEQQQPEADEIDLIELARYLWDRRKFIIKITSIFIVFGIFIALFSAKEYTVSTILMPQVSEKSSTGNLGALAAMAGVSIGGTSSELMPVVYPKIVGSAPFQLELIHTKYHCPDVDEPVSLFEYYTEYSKPGVLSSIKKYTIGLPGVIIKAIRGEKEEMADNGEAYYLALSEDEQKVIESVSEQVVLDVNDKEGYVSVSITMGDAVLTAEVAQQVQSLLQKYITDFKVAQAKDQLQFVEGRMKEKEADFINAQNELATYRDRNHNVSSALAMTELERLQTKYNLAFSIYSELAKQYESALIKVKEETPVFTIIEPVRLPNEPSAPNKPLVVIIWAFLGGILSVGIIFGKKFIASVKEDWDKASVQE